MGSSWIHVYSECTERTVMLPCCNKVLWLCNRYKMLTSPLLPIWPHAREKKNSNEQEMPEVLSCQLCLLIVVLSTPTCTVIDSCAILMPTLLQKCLFLQQIYGSSTPPSSSGLTDCCLIVWYPTDSLLLPPFISHRKGEEHSCTIIIIIIIIHISQLRLK